MSPPIIGRYSNGPQGPGQYNYPQQQQLHPHAQSMASSGITPPAFGGQLGIGNAASNTNLFGASSAGHTANFGGAFGGAGAGLGARGGGSGLGSHAAQLGFAHGAALQREEMAGNVRATSTEGKIMMEGRIREVWKGNLAQEMAILRNLIDQYPYISMDSEFPGIVCRPMGNFSTKADYHYQTLRCNVDLLKMIQLGITLFSPIGNLPPPHQSDSNGASTQTYANNLIPCPCTWQFNFKFSMEEDMFDDASVTLLQKSGVDFDMHEKNGIDPFDFGASLIESGLVLVNDVRWISFHSAYDFAYLVKLMLCKPLPTAESEFCKMLKIFFPNVYDIKYLLNNAVGSRTAASSPLSPDGAHILSNLSMKSGLAELAEELNVKQTGPQHQAGSSSLATGRIFWEMKRRIFGGKIEEDRYSGQIWGLNGVGAPASAASAAVIAASKQQGAHGHGTPSTNGAHLYHNGGQPSTPSSSHVGLASTPGPNGGLSALTPGGGGGAFGAFQYGK